MDIVVTPTGVTLADASNFTQFATIAAEGTDIDAALREAGAGYFAGSHAWIDPAWLQESAAGDATWLVGFTGMLQFARSNEWIDAATGHIRSHVETPTDD